MIAIANIKADENADEKASFPTRNFPQDNSFRRDSARVYTTGSQKEGRKDTTQEHLSLAFRAAREKGRIHGSTRVFSVLYIHIYVYFLNKTKLVRVPVIVDVRREISVQNCKNKSKAKNIF